LVSAEKGAGIDAPFSNIFCVAGKEGRAVAYGYRYGEVTLGKLSDVKPSLKIGDHRELRDGFRPVQMVSSGFHYEGMVMPHPCTTDPLTAKAGVCKRFGFQAQQPNRAKLRRLNKFVRRWCKRYLTPLSPATDVSFETWLQKTPYTATRKEELKELWTRLYGKLYEKGKKYTGVKSFIKDEVYPEYKHARPINSTHDLFKCEVGRFFKCIEEVIYELPQFIKHVPVADRPAYIMNMLYQPGATYYESDYSSFESLFTQEIMESVEMVLYRYMFQHHPERDVFFRCLDVIKGRRLLDFKNFSVRIEATRMSGEMNTSLGNGFSNLMFFLFECEEQGLRGEGVVEGDDGLFTTAGGVLDERGFADMGLVIKLEKHDRISEASFCGIIFDEEDQINVTDVREVLVQFGWVSARYARARDSKLRALLRCKALSFAHQYPGCPIISSMAQCALRLTRRYSQAARDIVEKGVFNQWELEQLRMAFRDETKIPIRTPGIKTRFLVEQLYGVTVAQQVAIEQYFDNCNELKSFSFPILKETMPPQWAHYWENYVLRADRSQDLNYPSKVWSNKAEFCVEIQVLEGGDSAPPVLQRSR